MGAIITPDDDAFGSRLMNWAASATALVGCASSGNGITDAPPSCGGERSVQMTWTRCRFTTPF